ncbi:prepilin peptidase [Methylobacterium trifolii]|uniref:Prepilin type IV endopeptidase peptidase domain-containing protein n=1 Tax=Methylobacterium trifolii TaxID=1003092 RepID=A0ABQ4TXQ4_9HYPH|nr:prepilin peptidase [Methylobacterium trifolii]GJE60040.1 hypothetical protein MPOCJGCO_2149 [Methylobacterium trifolii]
MVEFAVCLLLVAVAVEDLRRFRIRNLSVLLLSAGFVAHCVERGTTFLLVPHAILAGAALALLIAAFVLGAIGGGDAKLLSAALFWVGPEGAFVFAVMLLVLTLLTIVAARLGLVASRGTGRAAKIPFGPSIAGAWLGVIGASHLL